MSSSCACIQPQSKQNFLKRPLAAAAISGTRCWLTSSGFIWRLASTSSLPRQNTKREPLFLKEVDNQALIQEHNQLSRAFRLFFQNPEAFGHPNFKRKKDDRDSFTACNHVFTSGPTIYTTRDGIRMTKAGMIRAVFPRRPQNGWKLKRVTVEKARTGRYYAYVLYESLGTARRSRSFPLWSAPWGSKIPCATFMWTTGAIRRRSTPLAETVPGKAGQ